MPLLRRRRHHKTMQPLCTWKLSWWSGYKWERKREKNSFTDKTGKFKLLLTCFLALYCSVIVITILPKNLNVLTMRMSWRTRRGFKETRVMPGWEKVFFADESMVIQDVELFSSWQGLSTDEACEALEVEYLWTGPANEVCWLDSLQTTRAFCPKFSIDLMCK